MTTSQQLGAAAALLAAGAAIGYWAHRPAVQIVEKIVEHEKLVQVKAAEKDTSTGPRIETRVVTRTVPGPRGPERVVERLRIEQGPSTVVYRTKETDTATREIARTLEVTPAPRPSWAIYAGLQLYPEKLPVLGVAHRLVGPLWLEAWARPRLELALPAAGAGLRVEF